MICDNSGIKCYYLNLPNHYLSFWEDMERFAQCNSISGQRFGDRETRFTNVATAMKKTASGAAVELEEIPSLSSSINHGTIEKVSYVATISRFF